MRAENVSIAKGIATVSKWSIIATTWGLAIAPVQGGAATVNTLPLQHGRYAMKDVGCAKHDRRTENNYDGRHFAGYTIVSIKKSGARDYVITTTKPADGDIYVTAINTKSFSKETDDPVWIWCDAAPPAKSR